MPNDLDALASFCTDHGRVCPLPMPWNAVWEMLPLRKRVGLEWQPPLPLILGAWAHTTVEEKRARLLDHLKWAEEYGDLPRIDAFLRGLPEDQWLHEGEWPA